ncbi:hypothetical protein Scep_002839 [Stephania cephalantha]|uniref:EF-hand domain-containing protein n=1 Tax=Stephania cephalantha TaxID=152367 RepID=A0AAP0Q5C9_9MAGN
MAQLGSHNNQTDALSEAVHLMEAFRAFDADNNGLITGSELGGIMASLGHAVSEQEVRAMMQKGDANKDGLLSMREFLDMTTKDLGLGGIASLLRPAFEAFDVNGDQVLSGEELFEVLANMEQGMSLEDCQAIIASMDHDGDGLVSFEEFKAIIDSL